MRFTRRQLNEKLEEVHAQFRQILADNDKVWEAIIKDRDRLAKWRRRRFFVYGWMAAGLFNWVVYATGLLDAGAELMVEKVDFIRQSWGF